MEAGPIDPFTAAPAPASEIPELYATVAMDASDAFNVSRAFGNGWRALKRAPVAMWLGGALISFSEQGCQNRLPTSPGGGIHRGAGGRHLLTMFIDGAERAHATWRELTGGVSIAHAQPLSDTRSEDLAIIGIGLAAAAFILLVVVALFCLRAWITPGTIRLHHHVLQTGEGSYGALFSGADRFFDQLLWQLVGGLVVFGSLAVAAAPAIVVGLLVDQPVVRILAILVGAVCALVVVIYVGLGVVLGDYCVTLERRGPIDALKRSWHLAQNNRGTLFVYSLVSGLLMLAAAIVGLLACLVGVLVTAPATRALVDFGRTESFLLLTRGQAVTTYWKLWSSEL